MIPKEQGEKILEVIHAIFRVSGSLLVIFCPSPWGRLLGLLLLVCRPRWVDDGRWFKGE